MPTPLPIVYDLYCGLGGWTEGFLSEGYRCIGFDYAQSLEQIERPQGGIRTDCQNPLSAQFTHCALL
jgi:hypothetical protein